MSLNAGSFRASCPVLHSVRLAGRSASSISLQHAKLQPDWNTDGVINEYCETCEAIVHGVHRELFAENHFGQVYAKPKMNVPHQRFGGSR